MSLIATRLALTQRATIERDLSSGTDDGWGNPESPDWQAHLVEVPCRAWVNAGKESVRTDRTVVVVDRRMLVPSGTDVTERDRVASVTERGVELLDGPMAIEAVLVRRTHKELVVTRIR